MTIRTIRRAFVPLGVALLLGATLLSLPADAATKKSRAKKSRANSTEYTAARGLLDAKGAVAEAERHYGARRDAAADQALDRARGEIARAREAKPDTRIRKSLDEVAENAAKLDLKVTARRLVAMEALAAGEVLVGPPDPSGLPAGSASDSLRLAGLPTIDVAPAPELVLPGETPADDDPAFALPALDDEAIAVEEHPLVDKWLDYFTGRGRPTFERWLARSGQYMDSMKGILEKEGVPTDLVHLVFVESGFNPQARSVASAVGPWQFIRGTANLFGLRVNSWVDERKDPEASTIAAARYLKHLYGLFNSWPLALASYNAGEGAVSRAIKRQGTRDFWSLRLPEETRNYVPKFMAVLAISRDPGRYGFDGVAVAEPLAFDEVTLSGPVDLRALAEACSTDLDVIKDLNPQFLRHAAAPASGGEVTVRVPDGAGERLMASLAEGSLALPTVAIPKDPAVLRHKVRRGESLKSLGLRYGVAPSVIAKKNKLGKSSRLRVGRTILIPQSTVTPRPMKDVVAAKTTGDVKPLALGSGEPPTPAAAEWKTVKVKKGQTLSGIAAAHGVTVEALREANGLKKKEALQAGQRLKIPIES